MYQHVGLQLDLLSYLSDPKVSCGNVIWFPYAVVMGNACGARVGGEAAATLYQTPRYFHIQNQPLDLLAGYDATAYVEDSMCARS